jgi:hypothetical protein
MGVQEVASSCRDCAHRVASRGHLHTPREMAAADVSCHSCTETGEQEAENV